MHSFSDSKKYDMSSLRYQPSWTRKQWTDVLEKPWNGVAHDATHVKKISMSETIGVTRKDDVWCWASDLMVVAQVCVGMDSSCVFIRTLYPC